MLDSKFKFQIPTYNNSTLTIPIKAGNIVFVLGSNGAGKSALAYMLYQQNMGHVKRILAHRQTWFRSNTADLTTTSKMQSESTVKHMDQQTSSRWMDDYAALRSNIAIFDLINFENIRARDIAEAVDNSQIDLAKKLSNNLAPIKTINELLKISNINIEISLDKGDQLYASKNGSPPYSIAELSDGERNALLICTDVLTAAPNTLIILDEPERHLHRSITSPLLSTLCQKRQDCAFVISTHDVSLPIDHKDSSILILRNCQWENKVVKYWDADLIVESGKIPSEIKRDILGSKRNILFVEGDNGSLDKQIYQLLYPNISIIPQKSCTDVEKSVKGMKRTEDIHWLNVYGLIDADDRTGDQLEKLLHQGIVATTCYSVESLYYDLLIVKKIAERYASISEENQNELYLKATSGLKDDIQLHKKRLCARICEKKIRAQIFSCLPKHKNIAKDDQLTITLNMGEILAKEEELFDKLLSTNDLDALIARYPIRETPVIESIVTGLGLDRNRYESSVRKMILDDPDMKTYLKNKMLVLTNLIDQ